MRENIPRATLMRTALIATVVFAALSEARSAGAQARTPEEQDANRRYHQLDAAYSQAGGRAGAPPASTAAATSPGPSVATAPTAQSTERPSCRKHFRIDGTNQILATAKHFKRFTPDEMEGYASGGHYTIGWKETWARKYARGGYQEFPGTHTKNQDCAGYVMDQLWRTGQTWVTAELLFHEVIAKHGKKISNPIGWGDTRIDDIVVWGEGKHVAIVKAVGADSIIIQTKDGVEPVYRKDLRKGLDGNDPLVQAYGTPHVYRVDTRRVRITPVSPADCDENPTDAEARVGRLVAALSSLPQCPGMQLGVACFQKYSVRKEGIAATTSLARDPPAGSERTDVRAVAWLDQATANRTFRGTFDALKTRSTSAERSRKEWKFEPFALAGQPDTGALAVWLDDYFGGEPREAGRATGVFICGRVEGTLTMFIAAGSAGYKGKALVDATQAQMKALLQQIAGAVQASGACA